MQDSRFVIDLIPGTHTAFEPFGWIIETGEDGVPANAGTASRHDVHALAYRCVRPGSNLVTSIFEARPQPRSKPIAMLERHVNSMQLIMPLSGKGHIVVVCSDTSSGAPDLSTLTAFFLSPLQGVVYRRGLWHHPIFAVDTDARFLVQSWQDGTDADCEITLIEQRELYVDEA